MHEIFFCRLIFNLAERAFQGIERADSVAISNPFFANIAIYVDRSWNLMLLFMGVMLIKLIGI